MAPGGPHRKEWPFCLRGESARFAMAGAMWRLHRYLFLSTAAIAFASVGVIVLLMVVGNALRDLFDLVDEGKITTETLFDLLQLLIPYTFSYAMPAGALMGVLVVVGRLSSNNELTALKASGISLWRVSVPLVLFCLLATGITAWINAYAAPSARASYKDLIPNAIRANPLRLIVPRQFVHDFPGYVVFVGDIEGEGQASIIRDVWIWELDDDSLPVRILRAEAGDLSYDVERDSLILRLEQGFVELRDTADPNDLGEVQPSLFFDNVSIRLPLEEVFGRTEQVTKVAYLSLPQKLDRLDSLRQRLARAPPVEREALQREITQVRYRIQDGFASAVSALSLGLLAIPLGIKVSRQETSVNVGLAIALMLLYYLSNEMLAWLRDNPAAHPELLVWLPNLVAQGFAAWLFLRANRH